MYEPRRHAEIARLIAEALKEPDPPPVVIAVVVFLDERKAA